MLRQILASLLLQHMPSNVETTTSATLSEQVSIVEKSCEATQALLRAGHKHVIWKLLSFFRSAFDRKKTSHMPWNMRHVLWRQGLQTESHILELSMAPGRGARNFALQSRSLSSSWPIDMGLCQRPKQNQKCKTQSGERSHLNVEDTGHSAGVLKINMCESWCTQLHAWLQQACSSTQRHCAKQQTKISEPGSPPSADCRQETRVLGLTALSRSTVHSL